MREAITYFDYHSSTPCDARVVEAMIPFFLEHYANAASVTHRAGTTVNQRVAEARVAVSKLIGANRNEIVFTSSATESNNLVAFGLGSNALRDQRQLLTSSVEHKSVLEPIKELGRRGVTTAIITVDSRGHIRMDELEQKLISHPTLLVSVQAASNEIGTVQHIQRIAEMAHRYGALIHCDATQAVGRMAVDVNDWQVDFMSFSAHKLYGPKGIAALYIRGGSSRSQLQPLMFGGEQEDGLRPGTLNVPGIVGFGIAAMIAQTELGDEVLRIAQLRDTLERNLLDAYPDIRRNGDLDLRLPGNSSLTFGVDAEALIARLPSFALSMGSACSSGSLHPSDVLQAIGLSREEAYMTLRIGLGRFTTPEEVQALSDGLISQISLIKRNQFSA